MESRETDGHGSMAAAERLRRTVEAIILRGFSAVCGREYSSKVMGKSNRARVRRKPKQGGADFETLAATYIYRDLAKGANGGIAVTVSDLGLRRTFKTPEDLARMCVGEMPVGDASSPIHLVDIEPKSNGRILILTREALRREQGLGKLLCPKCVRFFSGDKGLRLHQQIAHKTDYGEAKAISHLESTLQLVPYIPPQTPPIRPPPPPFDAKISRENKKTLRNINNLSGKTHGLHLGLELVRKGDLEGVRRLVRSGWDPRLTYDRHGSNALLWAAGGGHIKICKYLIEGCKIFPASTQPKDGRNALHWACRNGHLEATKDGTSPFHWAVWQRHKDVCQWLVFEAKANPHAKNSYGCNAMQWAAMSGDVTMCRWLVMDVKINPKVKNTNGHSALHKAAIKGKTDVCKWLLGPDGGLGYEHMMADNDGNTPAIMARLEGYLSLATWLEGVTEGLKLPVVKPTISNRLSN
ncbi:hypothetical protein AAMO2058_000178700 [Amorphochlora amoebiformis]